MRERHVAERRQRGVNAQVAECAASRYNGLPHVRHRFRDLKLRDRRAVSEGEILDVFHTRAEIQLGHQRVALKGNDKGMLNVFHEKPLCQEILFHQLPVHNIWLQVPPDFLHNVSV